MDDTGTYKEPDLDSTGFESEVHTGYSLELSVKTFKSDFLQLPSTVDM